MPITAKEELFLSNRRKDGQVLLPMQWLFPGMLISAVCNQQEWSALLLVIGRVSFWLCIAAAIYILFSSYKGKEWLLAAVCGLLLSKLGRIATNDNSFFYFLYTIFIGVFFCGAGLAVARRMPQLVYRQVMLFCLLSIPLMVLQLTGFSEWTQALRTDYHGEAITQFPTLFVDSDKVAITTLQARPAGFLYANNFLSLIIIFGLALHYGISRSRKLNWQDMALCVIAVLSMSKLVFLTFAVIHILRLILGNRHRRIKTVKVTCLFLWLLVIYAFFFPGVADYTLSLNNFYINFKIRYADLMAASAGKTLTEITFTDFEGNAYGNILRGTHESGYAQVAHAYPYLIPIILLLLPLYLKALKKLRLNSALSADSAFMVLVVLVLSLLASSFLEGAVFWFMAGFAFLPFREYFKASKSIVYH